MKIYIKRMLNNASKQHVFDYITKISTRIPFRIFDKVTKKINTKLINS
jgi:hypothetical protein